MLPEENFDDLVLSLASQPVKELFFGLLLDGQVITRGYGVPLDLAFTEVTF